MSKNDPEKILEELRAQGADLAAPAHAVQLTKILRGRSAYAIAALARSAAEQGLSPLETELVTAFARLLTGGPRVDPGCQAKTAIAEALYGLDLGSAAVHLKGIRCRQWEAVWGGKVDTAVELRCVCALALVRMNHPEVQGELAELLADPEHPARSGAARALAYAEDPAGIALLRHKICAGDEEDGVLGECMRALWALSPPIALELAERWLDERDAAEAIALGLAEAHDPALLPLLQGWVERAPRFRPTAFLVMAMNRSEEAFVHLLDEIMAADGPNARDAISALAIFRHDAALMARLRAAVESRSDLDLGEALTAALHQ